MTCQPRNVTATLNYHVPASEGGAAVFMAGTVGEKRRKMKPVTVDITDMRGHEHDFHLDKQGFQIVKKPSTATAFDDDEVIKSVYYPDCIDLIKKRPVIAEISQHTGASEVQIYNYAVRRRRWEEIFEAEKDLPDHARSIATANSNFVHIDHSYDGAWKLAEHVRPGLSERIKSPRWAIINLWRPITHPVTRSNLAMCDARSVPEADLQEVEVVFPHSSTAQNSTSGLKDSYAGNGHSLHWELKPPLQDGQHRWYYCSELNTDEAILLKIFDSDTSGVARRSPHTAFVCKEDYGKARESIEVRCMVVWDDEAKQ